MEYKRQAGRQTDRQTVPLKGGQAEDIEKVVDATLASSGAQRYLPTISMKKSNGINNGSL